MAIDEIMRGMADHGWGQRADNVDLIRTSVSSAVMTITLDEDQRRNALSQVLVRKLLEAVE